MSERSPQSSLKIGALKIASATGPAASGARRGIFYLEALRELSVALASGAQPADAPAVLKDSLYRILGTLAVARGVLWIWDAASGTLTVAAAKGVRAARREQIAITPKDWVGLAASGTEAFHPHFAPAGAERAAEALRPAIVHMGLEWLAPLATGETCVGVLALGPAIPGRPLDDWELSVLAQMTTMLALHIEAAQARRRIAAQQRELAQQESQFKAIYMDAVRALAAVIDGPAIVSDAEESGGSDEADATPTPPRPTHSVRVAALAADMGRRAGLPAERCEALYIAGLLHDLGKQIVAREILNKPGPLDAGERRALEAHPAAACALISHLRFPWRDVAEIIKHHHERPDGQGYPDRLTSHEISLEAKLLMMAEAFDAMTSDQPWRARLPFDAIIEQIQANLGLQFEPQAVRALCESVEAGLKKKSTVQNANETEMDFVPHLEAAFDPTIIRGMLGELRRQMQQPTPLKSSAQIIALNPDTISD